jgi:hypothetical protein
VQTEIIDVLYSVISGIGLERIRMDIVTDIKSSETYCKDILSKCVAKLRQDDETLVTLSEALLHFMLTVSLLPSERKIITHGVELDIVIPSVKVLNRTPDKSLVIQLMRGDIDQKLSQAISVQPHCENIWLISARELQTSYRNYCIRYGELSYACIVCDINTFLSKKGKRGLKLLP